jgi:hypothetical protein
MATRIPNMATPRSNGKKRVLLDTNIWRYVVDCNSQGQLLRLARKSTYNVQIAPAVLYETLRLKDSSLRSALVRLMTNSRFHRLMPEAYSESMEILQEIERVRPDWLRDTLDLQSFNRHKKDWTRKKSGFWDKCARDPEGTARFIGYSEGSMIDTARAESQSARKEMIDLELKPSPPMYNALAGFPNPVPGWRGDKVEAWRIEGWIALTKALRRDDGAYRDWISPFVELDFGLLSSAVWLEFWLYLTDDVAMPRQYMRWAYSFSQRFRKTTPGSPGDMQLATYFPETDVVISADRALLKILEECRPYAPCQLPDGKHVAAGAPGVTDLLRYLES